MQQKNKWKDSRVKELDLKTFLENHDYLKGLDLSSHTCSLYDSYDWVEYYFLSNRIVAVFTVSYPLNDFSDEYKDKIERIEVANRDGVNEYELLKEEIERLKAKKVKGVYNRKLNKAIRMVENTLKSLPPFKKAHRTSTSNFQSYVLQTNHASSKPELASKYVVLDVETNGLRTAKDDLLSISIFDPLTGECYNRFLPLDLQPIVLTNQINGIDSEDLENYGHIDQEEMNELISHFRLKERTILTYSGGKGTFDMKFVCNYCSRHAIKGFDQLAYDNIKNYLPKIPQMCSGNATKDNLCSLFKIDGVNNKHSSSNDCILEWNLFEKIYHRKLFFIRNRLYEFNPNYIIPVSILYRVPELREYAELQLDSTVGRPTLIFEDSWEDELSEAIHKFPSNISGVALEHVINSALNANNQDNIAFLKQNKKQLKFIGSLIDNQELILVQKNADGTLRALDDEHEDYIEEVNQSSKLALKVLTPLINYLKENVFQGKDINSQELCFSTDRKLLALCDLSSENSIVEIKTCKEVFLVDEHSRLRTTLGFGKQLYICSKGRETYLLHLISSPYYDEDTQKYEHCFSGAKLYHIHFEEYKRDLRIFPLGERARNVLRLLRKDNTLSITKIANELNLSPLSIKICLSDLERYGYIKRIGDNPINSVCIVLKDEHWNDVSPETQKTSRQSCFVQRYQEMVLEKSNGTVTCIQYQGCQLDAEYQCNKCGHQWKTKPRQFKATNKCHCPVCHFKRND